jgi:hypothetical protein
MEPNKKSDWNPETFPQPRTFPSGWDGSEMSTQNGSRKKDREGSDQSTNENEMNWSPEKFPKPRTFPKNWSIDD